MQPWVILSHRFGGDTRDPSIEDLREALHEIYNEAHPSLTEADYEEHPSAFVRRGTDSGPMFALYVGRTQSATLEQWADQDYEQELAPPLTIENVPFEQALQMWCALCVGDLDELRRKFETEGRE